jgi:hypothetical protein
MDPVKVAGVREWPVPKSKKEVQSFVGFANFYCRFIAGFLHHACALFDLTKKDVKFEWTEREQRAFDKIKKAVTSAPVLVLPDCDQPFRIEADGSGFATGTVLSQLLSEDNKWHPVAFLSKSLNEVERNYQIHDTEMLAIIRALEEWRHYLEGAKHSIEILTNHKNLEYFRVTQVSTGNKHDSLCIFCDSTSPSTIIQERAWASPTPFRDTLTTDLAQTTTAI